MNRKEKIILHDAFKRFTFDQDKIISPDETIKKIKDKLKKLNIDMLEDTIRIDNGRLDIPVYLSICGKDAIETTGTKKQMGKGGTPAQAEASAIMELAERFSFFSFCKNSKNFILKKFKDLEDESISFEMIAKSVHDSSDDLKITRDIFEDITLKWTWGYNLTQQKEVMVPFNWFFAINEFNGPSAGNCVEEAISQGICEIVERHVSSIISYQKINVPGIDPDSATDPLVIEMIKKYKKIGIKLFLSDFSLNMGIPTIGVLAYDPSTFPEKSEMIWTAGTSPDPQKALSRALTETAQLAGDFNTSSNYVASGLPKFKKIEETEFIINSGKIISIKSIPDISSINIKNEVINCIEALKNKGMDVIVINTMHPKLGIPAFYTIVPGAHFRERAIGTSVLMFSAKLIVENNEPDIAILQLEEINKKLPEKYYIKFYLGLSYLSIGNFNTSLTYFNESLLLNPVDQDIPTIYSYMGLCLKEIGEYNKAIEVLEKGIILDKERTDIYNLLGFCYFKLKMNEKAIEYFKKVLQLNPGSAIDYANIASNYRDMGDKENAIRNYEMALLLDPTIKFARENLIKLQQR